MTIHLWMIQNLSLAQETLLLETWKILFPIETALHEMTCERGERTYVDNVEKIKLLKVVVACICPHQLNLLPHVTVFFWPLVNQVDKPNFLTCYIGSGNKTVTLLSPRLYLQSKPKSSSWGINCVYHTFDLTFTLFVHSPLVVHFHSCLYFE